MPNNPRRRIAAALLALAAFSPCGAVAETPDYAAMMAEAAWDWQPGDLIFLNGINALDELIRQAEGGDWGSVGILRPSSGDPRVVFADEEAGVAELILYEITDRRAPSEYAVYRIGGTSGNGLGLLTNYSLFSAYGSGFDRLMLFGNGAFYNAELVFEAALSEGHVLGTPRKLAGLTAMEGPLAQALLAEWQAHPLLRCGAVGGECWEELREIAVATPGTLLASGRLEQVYP